MFAIAYRADFQTACGGFGFAYSFTETPSHLGMDTSCSCANSIGNIDWVVSNSNTCPEGDYTIHDISAKTKRQLNKRADTPETSTDPNLQKRKEKLVKEKRRDPRDLCPTRMVACKVQDVDAYECLDVSSELGKSVCAYISSDPDEQNRAVDASSACTCNLPTENQSPKE
jgi:ATP-dependent helicase YprA (DUF1998 family)